MAISSITLCAIFALLLCTLTSPSQAAAGKAAQSEALDELVRELKELTAAKREGEDLDTPTPTTATETPPDTTTASAAGGQMSTAAPPTDPVDAVDEALEKAEEDMEDMETKVEDEIENGVEKAEEEMEKERKRFRDNNNRGGNGRDKAFGRDRANKQKSEKSSEEKRKERARKTQERVLSSIVRSLRNRRQSLENSIPNEERVAEVFNFLDRAITDGQNILDGLKQQQKDQTHTTEGDTTVTGKARQLRRLLDLLSKSRP